MKAKEFRRYQLVKYKGKRYIVDHVDDVELYLHGSSNMKFMVGSDEYDSITTDEPLLENDISLDSLVKITKSSSDKDPLIDSDKESLIKALSPKNGINSGDVKKLHDCIRDSNFNYDFYSNVFNYLYNFSTEELGKLFYNASLSSMARDSFLQENNPTLWILHKIANSYWRNGMRSDNWNQVVDSYESLRTFDLGIKDFTVKLDTSSGYNDKGYSRFNRIYLDGMLSYAIYYKGKLVLNVSFCFTQNDKGVNVIQVRQIQCVNKKGNRWIYKMSNYVETILYKFVQHFTNHKVLLLKPDILINQLNEGYQTALINSKESLESCDKTDNSGLEYHKKRYESSVNNMSEFENHGIDSINKTLGYKFEKLKRVRCSIKGYNILAEKKRIN